jgi:DNA-binding MarR family transcriptional regulator
MAHSGFAHQAGRDSSVLCLCGSSRCAEAFEAAGHWLTLEGHIVVSIMNPPLEDAASSSSINALSEVERQKIEHCDELIVLNANGYIDEATRRQLVYAQRAGLPVSFLEPVRWNAPTRGVRHAPKEDAPLEVTGTEVFTLEEGAVLDLTQPFLVVSGAVLLYGPDETRPAFTLVANHVWPGVRWVSEVWYAEAATNTAVRAFEGGEAALQPLGELIRWAVGTSGQISERMLWALLTVGSVSTQDELSAIIGCRRESVTSAMRDLKAQGLIEKAAGRIRLTERGVVCAANLCSFSDNDEDAELEPARAIERLEASDESFGAELMTHEDEAYLSDSELSAAFERHLETLSDPRFSTNPHESSRLS